MFTEIFSLILLMLRAIIILTGPIRFTPLWESFRFHCAFLIAKIEKYNSMLTFLFGKPKFIFNKYDMIFRIIKMYIVGSLLYIQ